MDDTDPYFRLRQSGTEVATRYTFPTLGQASPGVVLGYPLDPSGTYGAVRIDSDVSAAEIACWEIEVLAGGSPPLGASLSFDAQVSHDDGVTWASVFRSPADWPQLPSGADQATVAHNGAESFQGGDLFTLVVKTVGENGAFGAVISVRMLVYEQHS
jgi:hypothetical protein